MQFKFYWVAFCFNCLLLLFSSLYKLQVFLDVLYLNLVFWVFKKPKYPKKTKKKCNSGDFKWDELNLKDIKLCDFKSTKFEKKKN